MGGEVEELARRWSDQLAEWAIPADILERAPESPWGFPTAVFAQAARDAMEEETPSPSRRRALEALGGGGTVVDVGVGAGAASLPLCPPATHVVGVDDSEAMLGAFADGAAQRGVAHDEVRGRWPDVGPAVASGDVVVCHHVVYNVADLVPFVDALHSHARRRVVLELTAEHPQAELNPLWLAIHGVERPTGPTAADAEALLRAMGLPVVVERFRRPTLWNHQHRAHRVEFARRRLCVGPEHDAAIEQMLPEGDRQLVALWWDR
ncbi:MAG TPA: methyltransferase domain-containing protein [Acidimicrobiales bacterium]|nr:methyltransferase domain-containing protein [Acidimicrobiales bacterium]